MTMAILMTVTITMMVAMTDARVIAILTCTNSDLAENAIPTSKEYTLSQN